MQRQLISRLIQKALLPLLLKRQQLIIRLLVQAQDIFLSFTIVHLTHLEIIRALQYIIKTSQAPMMQLKSSMITTKL